MMISLIFRILWALTAAYLIMCIIRIISTWFTQSTESKALEFLSGITDPWLNAFRRLGLHIGAFDLSVLISVGILSVVSSLFSAIANYGYITLSFVLIEIFVFTLNCIQFIIAYFVIVGVIRLFAYAFKANSFSPFIQMLDTFLNPVLFRISRIFFGKKNIAYPVRLSVIVGALAVVWIALHFLGNLITLLIALIPF